MIDCAFPKQRAPFPETGDGKVQQLNVHEYYELGKAIDHLEREIAKIEGNVAISTVVWALFFARWRIQVILAEPCALPPASQRAARSVVLSITNLVPDDIDQAFKIPNTEMVNQFSLSTISESIKNFETVLKNDLPEMSTFAVAQIGIYRTVDLINRAHMQIEESLQPHLLPLAHSDVIEAGRCLAFRVPTAAAFHMSRAIETGMNQYYEALTAKPYDLKPGANNWGTKIRLLGEVGAEKNITVFLDHLRDAYRNPITHPEVIVEPAQAFGFFSQAISVISLMLGAVQFLTRQNQPLLVGLGNLGGLYGTETGVPAGGIQPYDAENSLDLEAGVESPDRSGEAS